MSIFRPLTSTVAAAALASALVAQPAYACGGFFCNNSQPVNQAAERIIFAVAADGTVTATIQIQYSGDADSFAWVLPVTGSPEVGVSSNLAFTRLQSLTNPSYVLNTRTEGTCADAGGRGFRGAPSFNAAGGPSDAAVAAADAGPVRVVDEGSVGPYDYVVISVDRAADLLTDVAVDWLHANGYQIDEAGAERLLPYLEAGQNLLAFRLTSGASVGSIRPVEITFGTGVASIPIRPTAVAAVADMGVMVWVVGRDRSVPVNYMSLELNEALINWLSPSASYNSVVIEAANQAGGQGFVTEMAGDAAPLADGIFARFEIEQWNAFRTTDWSMNELGLIQSAVSQYGGFDGLRDAVARAVPLPMGTTVEDVVSCPSCVFADAPPDIAGFEPGVFLAALETSAIEPMRRMRQLFIDRPYMTRMYTTMSADEMTRDPVFDFNGNLPDVSNLHTADRVIECSPSVFTFEAPWRIELANGEIVRGNGGAWPFTPGSGAMPANARISRLDTEGEGVVVVDNATAIASALTDHNASLPRVPGTAVAGGGVWCHAGHGRSDTSGVLFSLAALVGLVVARRSRR